MLELASDLSKRLRRDGGTLPAAQLLALGRDTGIDGRMFLPASFALVLAVMWVAGGALLGVALGWVSARLFGLRPSRAGLDAAIGGAAILTMYALMAGLAGGARIADDHTLGWRGILFDHLVLWGTGLVCLAVVGRHFVIVRIARRSQHGSPPRATASDTRGT